MRLKLLEESFRIRGQGARLDNPVKNRPQRMAILHVFEFRVHKLCWVSQPLDQTLPVVRLIAKDSRISVLAFVGLGYGCRLTVARAFRNLARHTVPRDDS